MHGDRKITRTISAHAFATSTDRIDHLLDGVGFTRSWNALEQEVLVTLEDPGKSIVVRLGSHVLVNGMLWI